MRDRAMTAAAKREETAWKDVNALQEALQKFSIFRSNATLHDLETRANQLGAEFPMGSDPTKAGPLPRRVAELRKEAEIARRDFLTRGVEKNVQRLERTANMLKEIEGFEPMAALYYEVIVQKLAPLSADPTFKSQLDKARGELEALRTKHADAIPPLPR